MKTIGVLGGLGPQATIDFETRIHQVAPRLTSPHGNLGYSPMLVYYYRHPVMLVNADFTPRFPLQPDPRLLEAARHVGALVDFLVITANSPHRFQEQIEQAAGRTALSMIALTLEHIRQRKWSKVVVLGLGDPLVYTAPLGERTVAYETIDGERRAKLDGAIINVMEGRHDTESGVIAREAIATLRARGVDGTILGCMELPLLIHEYTDEPDLVNPAQLLADATVQSALA